MKTITKAPILFRGGDYNPDQWLDRPDILEKDVEMMKKGRHEHRHPRRVRLGQVTSRRRVSTTLPGCARRWTACTRRASTPSLPPLRR